MDRGDRRGDILFRAIAWQALDGPPHRLAKFNVAAEPVFRPGVLIRPYILHRCNAEAKNAVVFFSPYMSLGVQTAAADEDRGLYPHEVPSMSWSTPSAMPSFGNAMHPLSGGLRWYENTEEFISVMVMNIFMMDPSKKWDCPVWPAEGPPSFGQTEQGIVGFPPSSSRSRWSPSIGLRSSAWEHPVVHGEAREDQGHVQSDCCASPRTGQRLGAI